MQTLFLTDRYDQQSRIRRRRMFSNSLKISRSYPVQRKTLYMTVVLFCIVCSLQRTHAQAASTPDKAVSDIEAAPVKVDGQTLFVVRGVSAYPAEQRAREISGHIRAVARDRGFNTRDIKINETPFATQIVAGDLVIVNLFDSDAQLEQVRRQTLGTAFLRRIQATVEEHRRERQPDVLIRHAALAVAAAVGLLLLWFFGVRITRFVLRALERRYKHRIREVGIQSLKL